jgi:predicted nucleotidyltransferase
MKLRDRDAIVTKEGLIFRVFGYSHLPNACICDVEYAPSEIFTSNNPKAPRSRGQHMFYKFYEDEGQRFVKKHYPQYLIFHPTLRRRIVGVKQTDVDEVKKPRDKLAELMTVEPRDELMVALHAALQFAMQSANLSVEDFGVFGSLLHDFYHPRFSDLDFVVYGSKKLVRLCEALEESYRNESSPFGNEFQNSDSIKGKPWRFRNYSAREFVWHQQRKLIYSLFKDENRGIIKTEFEPVKEWNEVKNEYDPKARVLQKGWVKMSAQVTDDGDAPFVPSVYGIEPLRILDGVKNAEEVIRIVSYMEEFRMQACKDEKVYVEGNLEEAASPKGNFYQVTLTCCPRYYEQVLKVIP